MNEQWKSNADIMSILSQILNTTTQKVIAPKDLVLLLNNRCYPKAFDVQLFQTLLSKPGVVDHTRNVVLSEFTKQYVELKDSTEFEWMNCKIRMDQLVSQREQTKSSPVGQDTTAVTLWIRTITITSLKQLAEKPCSILIDYQAQTRGETSPYKFKDTVCVMNEQITINVTPPQMTLTIRLQEGKQCIGLITLDLATLQQSQAQELNLPFIISKQTPLSNEYQLQALLMFVNYQPDTLNESTMDEQNKKLQAQRQQTLANLMAPLLKPLTQTTQLPSQIQPQQQPPADVSMQSEQPIEEQKEVRNTYQPNFKVPMQQYHNQPYSQFQLYPPMQRQGNNYPADRGTQTDPRSRHVEIQQSPPAQTIVEEDLFEQELLGLLDAKVKLSAKTHALIFAITTVFILTCSVLINLFRVQLDLIIILLMLALQKTHQLDTKTMKYIFAAFLVNIFVDVVWLCQVDGMVIIANGAQLPTQGFCIYGPTNTHPLQAHLLSVAVENLRSNGCRLPRCIQFLYLQFLINFMNRILRQAFSSVNVGFKLHYPEGHAKLFTVGSHLTVPEVCKLIQEEEQGRFLNMRFTLDDKDYSLEEMGFIDLAVHNPIVLTIDGVNFAYEIDSHGAANYIFDDHGFEAEFDRLEIPFQDSYVIGKFYTQLMENVQKLNQKAITPQTLQTSIDETLSKFGQKNQRNSQYWKLYAEGLQSLYLDYKQKEQRVQEVNVEANNEGNKVLKRWIAISILQYMILLGITYGVYSWNVSEPISYLWALGLETIGIFYFLRRGFLFRQSVLFQTRAKEIFNARINKKHNSTNYLQEVAFSKMRVHMINNKILYGTTSQ